MTSEGRTDFNFNFFLACTNLLCHGFNPGLLIYFQGFSQVVVVELVSAVGIPHCVMLGARLISSFSDS